MVDNRPGCVYNIPCQQRRARLTEPNNGDLHSGSAVDSDSTCGSSILSSPTRPQPVGLRYFRGIAQLVARLVRDEEAVGSNPAAPTMTDILTASDAWNIRLFLSVKLRRRRELQPAQSNKDPGPFGVPCWHQKIPGLVRYFAAALDGRAAVTFSGGCPSRWR